MANTIITKFQNEGLADLATDLDKASDKMDLFAKAHSIVSTASDGLSKKQLELREQINSTGGILQKMNETNRQSGTLYDGLQKQLTGLVAEYTALESKTKENTKTQVDYNTVLKQVADGQISARTGMKQLREEMVRMAAQGRTNEDTYKKLRKSAGELADTISDVSQEAKAAGSDTRGFDNLVRSVNLGVNAVTGLQGAFALFGGESKDVLKTIQLLNAGMLVSTSVQQVATELTQKDSVVTQALTYAKKLYTAAMEEATAATEIFYGLATGGLILVLGLIAANWDKITEALGFATDSTERLKEATEKLRQAEEDRKVLQDAELRYLKAKGIAQDEIIKKEIAIAKAELATIEQRIKYASARFVNPNDPNAFEERKKAAKEVEDIRKQSEAELLSAKSKILELEKALGDFNDKRRKEEEDERERLRKEREERIKNSRLNLEAYIKSLNDQNQLYRKFLNERLKLNAENIEKIKEQQASANRNEQIRLEELLRLNKLNADKLAEIKANENRDKQQNDDDYIAAKAKREADGFAITQSVGNAVLSISKMVSDSKMAYLDAELNSGVISQKKYQQEVRKIKRNEAIAAKAEAAFNIGLSIAQSIVKALTTGPIVGQVLAGITAALGFAQLAFVVSKPIPQFRKGGKVSEHGLLKGRSHEQGGVIIEAERDEYFMPTDKTRKHYAELEAMRNGNYDDYIQRNKFMYLQKMQIPMNKVLNPDLPAVINISGYQKRNQHIEQSEKALNLQFGKVAEEISYLGAYIKSGNADRVRGTKVLVKAIDKLIVNGY